MNNNTEQKLRLFVAVDMPEVVRQEIVRIQYQLQKQNLFEGRYVDAGQAHSTIKFIGEVSPELIFRIDKALQTIDAKKGNAQLGSLDAFFSGSHIKVVHLTIICPELGLLAEQIDEKLAPWVKPENRSFVSHLTIARVKWVQDRQQLLQALQAIQLEPLHFVIDSFVLKQSELFPEGPIYTDLARYPLK